jgi:hypothetical protein
VVTLIERLAHYRLALHLTEYSSFVSQTCHGSLYTVNEGIQVESQKDSNGKDKR